MTVNMTISMNPKIEDIIKMRSEEIGLTKSGYLRMLVLKDAGLMSDEK